LSYRASENVEDLENVSAVFADNDPRSMDKSLANRTEDLRESAAFGS